METTANRVPHLRNQILHLFRLANVAAKEDEAPGLLIAIKGLLVSGETLAEATEDHGFGGTGLCCHGKTISRGRKKPKGPEGDLKRSYTRKEAEHAVPPLESSDNQACAQRETRQLPPAARYCSHSATASSFEPAPTRTR